MQMNKDQQEEPEKNKQKKPPRKISKRVSYSNNFSNRCRIKMEAPVKILMEVIQMRKKTTALLIVLVKTIRTTV